MTQNGLLYNTGIEISITTITEFWYRKKSVFWKPYRSGMGGWYSKEKQKKAVISTENSKMIF